MPHKFTGKIKRLHVDRDRTYIRLESLGQKRLFEDYFRLELEQPNYNAIYSLVISAALNDYKILVRTTEDITPNDPALVSYVILDF